MKLRRRRQLGATTVEYSMLVSLVVVATIPALNVLGGAASASFDEQAVALSGTDVSAASAPTPAPTPPAGPTPTPTPTPIPNVAPNASFTATCTHLTCAFTDTSTDTDGTIVGWQWSYGDSTESTTQHGEHTYASGGIYEVTLQVTDEDGATASWSLDAAPTDPPPVADAAVTAEEPVRKNESWTATFALTVTETAGTESSSPKDVVVTGEVVKVADDGTEVRGSATCTTGPHGCEVKVADLADTIKTVTFTVTDVGHDGWDTTDLPSATSTRPPAATPTPTPTPPRRGP